MNPLLALGLGLPELLLVFGLCAGGSVFWIWMIIDCATKEKESAKVVWLLVILLGGIIGAPIYFFVRKLPRYEESLRIDPDAPKA